MTSRALVDRWRRRLVGVVTLAALGTGTASGILSFVIGTRLGGSSRQGMVLGVMVAVVVAVIDAARRLGGPVSMARMALWLEERVPAMQYALVSAVGVSPPSPQLEAVVSRVGVTRPAWAALSRALVVPFAAFALALAALALSRSEAGAVAVPAATAGARGPTGTALERIRVTVRPPAYTGRAASTFDDPEIVRPLAGSSLLVRGTLAGGDAPVVARLDSAALAVTAESGEWRAGFAAPSVPAVLALQQAGASRLVAVEPQPDSAPSVVLVQPARDTVLREPRGRFALEAQASDDIGLGAASFEYIVSSGAGEQFTFRSGTLGARRAAGARQLALRATLDLEALQLQPGDVLHLRAVARDLSPPSAASPSASDTRTFRVARAGEYDSIAVEAAPPPEVDKTLLSQRMLINLTEALVRRSRTLARADLVSESRRIARDQARLRKQVSDLVFARLGDDPSGEHFHGDGHEHAEGEVVQGPLTPEQLLRAAERATQITNEATDFAHDETPVVAINRPLLEAYNAMWDAGRELDAAEPRRALPPMYAALAAIQKARAAERLYLRGVPPRVVVDLARVRLQGRERGGDAARAADPPLDDPRRAALDRLQRALALGQGAAAADSLLLIRLSLVGDWPTAAAALESLITDVRAGRDASASLLAARRALDASTAVGSASAPWGRLP